MTTQTSHHIPLAAVLLAGLLLLPACDRQSKEQIAQLQARVQSLQQGSDSLAAQRTEALQQASELKTRADDLAAERDDLKSRLTAAQGEARLLETQVEDLKKAAATAPAQAPAAPAPTMDAARVRARLEGIAADLFNDSNYNAVNAVLLSACDLGSKGPLTFYRLAYASASVGRYGDAAGWYEKALSALAQERDADPDLHKRCLSNYGVALARTGKVPEAISAYTKALGIDPSYGPALYNLALLYARRTGDRDKAIDALRQYVAHGGARRVSARNLLQELLSPAPAQPTSPSAP